jgi:hypothetical protein
MVSPLISALLGAGEQYMADEDASDQLKGDIIDGVSKKYFDVELPAQKNTINAMKEVKRQIANQYGDKIADIGDNYGFYEDGNIERAMKRIEDFIATTRDTTQTFRNKVEKMSPEDFASVFGKTSMIGAREQSLEDRETRVNNIFSDRSNVRDLLVSPDAPQGGVRGFLFGDRLKQKDVISARGKLEKRIEDRPPEIEQVDRQSIFDVKTGAVQEAAATVADSIPLFLPAIPKYSTNELNTEIVDDFFSSNFTNYAKAQEGAFGPIEGTAVDIQDKLVTAAEEFAANSGDKTLMDADQAIKVVSYLADRAEQFVGNDDTISYYLKSIPQIQLGEKIKDLRFAVQFAYNKNNARGR